MAPRAKKEVETKPLEFSDFSSANIKKIIKQYNDHLRIKNYSSLSREELIELAEKHFEIDHDNELIVLKAFRPIKFTLPDRKGTRRTVNEKMSQRNPDGTLTKEASEKLKYMILRNKGRLSYLNDPMTKLDDNMKKERIELEKKIAELRALYYAPPMKK
jgi:hypothetical protein